MAQRSGDRGEPSRRKPPHHVRARLERMTYMFDGDGRVMGVVLVPQRSRRERTREGGRALTLFTRDVRVNNMARGKRIHGRRCEYLWSVKIVWLVEPAGGALRPVGGADLSAIRVGQRPAVRPPGRAAAASGWVCRDHLAPGWRKRRPVSLDRRTGRRVSVRVRLKSLPGLEAVTERAERRDWRIRPRETHPYKNRETDYLLRAGRVINIRIGEGSGLSSDTLLYSDRIRLRATRVYEQRVYRRRSDVVVDVVRNYLVRVTTSESGRPRNIMGWVSVKLLKRA